MINRIATKSNNVSMSESNLCVGRERFLEIPLATINAIKFYQATDLEAGYLAVVKNDFKDADIIFFHKNFEEHFKTISEEVSSHIASVPRDIY